MAFAPEWMTLKEMSPSEGSSRSGIGRERDRPKYGRQHSYNQLSYSPSNPLSSINESSPQGLKPPSSPFSCSVAAPLSPHAENNPRVLNRSKSSPGFGSPKSSKSKLKSPERSSFERNFPSFGKPLKPKPVRPVFSPASYVKSQSQPNLFNSDKTANWHLQKLQSTTTSPPSPAPHPTLVPPSPAPIPATSFLAHSAPASPSPSPPLPPSSSPPPSIVPDELDKLRSLVPSAIMPPKSVRPRALVGPPPPLTKRTSSNSLTASLPPSMPSSTPSISVTPAAAQPSSLASYFRKATSEPSLMHHKAQMERARLDIAAAKKAKVAESEKAEKAQKGQKQRRNNFFQNVIKQEGVEDDSPIGPPRLPPPPEEPADPPADPRPHTPSPPPRIRSPLPEDVQDEERFLRTLGWVPESEENVPELGEDEMADVRVKIFLSRSKGLQEEDVQKELDRVRSPEVKVE